MAVFQDILLNGLDGDYLFKNGDFVIGPSDLQHQHDIILDAPGYWHQYPTVGCNIVTYQDGDINLTSLSALIMKQLKADGYTVRLPKITFDISGSILDIQPNAVRN